MNRLIRALWLIVFAGLLVYLAFTAWLALSGLAYPYQLDYGEGPLLDQARLLSQGLPIYKLPDGAPHAFSNYPPLIQGLTALLIPWLGVTYAAGRIWNVLAVLLLGAMLYRVVLSGTASRSAAVAALAFVGSPYIYHWAPLFRLDLPGLLFSVLGIAVLATSRRRGLAVSLAALLFVLSLYAKHSFFAAPAAAFVFLWVQRRRDAVQLAAIMLAVGGGLFLWINYQTAGAFYFDLVTANANPFDLGGLLGQVGDFLGTFAVLAGLAVVAFGLRMTEGRGTRLPLGERLSVWDLYFVAALATMLLAGKVGSWENYFFEPLFALCLYAGLALGAAGTAGFLRRPWLRPLIPLLLLVQIALMFHTPEVAARIMSEDAAANREVGPLVAAAPGPVLSEDMGLLVTNDKPNAFFGFEYTQLARMGLWDQTWELGMLRGRGFSMAILEAGTRENPDRYRRFTRQFLSELDRSYALAASIGKYRLYRPAPVQRELQADFSGRITLAGYRLDAGNGRDAGGLQAGDALTVSLLWQATQAVTESYTVFVHLEDAQGTGWAGHDGVPFGGIYPTPLWAPGESVRDTHVLTLPANLPPGRYIVRVGLYAGQDQQRLRLSTGADSLAMAAVPVGNPPAAYAPVYPLMAQWAQGLSLLGYDVAKGSAPVPGAAVPLTVTLYWQANAYVNNDYTVFVHLLGAGEGPAAQHDGQPQGGAYPTSLWAPDEVVQDPHVLSLPAGAPPGEYRLAVGLYLLATGQRLPTATGGDQVVVGTVKIP